ncbi:MAG: oligopeptidase B, partial [Bdellovibrio sp.]|nr:oligopeptidase B [Bdellovibrio sp.]
MKRLSYVFLLLGASCMHKNPLPFPQPEKKPVSLVKHQDTRVDDYFWLRDRENPQVIEHLNQENKYADEVMKPVK